MVYTIFDVQVAKDLIGETVLFGNCLDDFNSFKRIGVLTKVYDESYMREPYEDQHGNTCPIIKTVDLSAKLLNIIAGLTTEEEDQLRRFLNEGDSK